MSSKIFKGIWIVALSVFLASFVFIMCISYNYFTELQKSRLKNEAELAAQGAANSGINYFDDLNTEGYRITWIGADGSVLYDNEADTAGMENHIEREEVRKALTEGYGESARYSDTLSDKQLYAAKRLPDGAVVRLSIVQATVWSLILGFAQPVCIVTVKARLSMKRDIVKPINEIDLDRPEQYYGEKKL